MPAIEKDRFRRLVIRGLSHDYKRILLSLTKKASEYRKLAHPNDANAVHDTYKYFTDSALAVAEQLDEIGNQIYEEPNIPATSILARHSSSFGRNVDQLVQTAERFKFILSLHANDKVDFANDTSDFVEQAKRARRQIQALLILPFKETELKFQRLNVKNEVRRITADLYALFIEYDCDPTKVVQIESTATLRTDQTMFSIAISNIIANSVVHSGRGPDLAIRVYEEGSSNRQFSGIGASSEQESHSDFLNIVIADNGPGIPSDERCEIFQLFKQGRSSQSRKDQGSGVGLTFARLAMELLGGSLTLKDSVDGAAFLLRFPLHY
jgi:signal transduction histidine kinase